MSIIRPENLEKSVTIDYFAERLAWEVGQQGLSGSFELFVPSHLENSNAVHDFIQELHDAGYTVRKGFGVSPTARYDIINISWDVPDVSAPFQNEIMPVEHEASILLRELGVRGLSDAQCFEHLTHIIGNPRKVLLSLRAIRAYTDLVDGDEERK